MTNPPARGSPELEQRIKSVDVARSFAIALMVLSHTVKGLMSFEMMPSFGIVPVHFLTKFSSSLFFLTFGAAVAVVYFPKVDDERWPVARWKLVRRALLIMVSYKALAVVQMYERNDWAAIADVLVWKQFPDFVEVLQFYSLFMLVLPFILRPVSRLSVVGLIFLAWMLGLGSELVRDVWDFGGNWQLQAILVEHRKAFCFGLITRGGFVLAGMAIGQALRRGPEVSSMHADPKARFRQVGGTLIALGVAALSTFFVAYRDEFGNMTAALAKNWGKHPPNLAFLLWSAGGAALVLGLLLRLEAAGLRSPAWLEILGREPLLSFNVHILVVFLIFRGAFGLRHEVTYAGALGLTLVNLGICGGAAYGKRRLSKTWKARRSRTAGTSAGSVEDDEPRWEVTPPPCEPSPSRPPLEEVLDVFTDPIDADELTHVLEMDCAPPPSPRRRRR